jgi:hypothetical protein
MSGSLSFAANRSLYLFERQMHSPKESTGQVTCLLPAALVVQRHFG